MVGYWREFFYDPLNPETSKFLIGYVKWAMYCYPVFLVQIPFVAFLLLRVFKPKQKNISRAIVRLREQIEEQGPMKTREWIAIGGFLMTLLGWIFFSDVWGLGIIAIAGAIFFLVVGLVQWNDVNRRRQLGCCLAVCGGNFAWCADERYRRCPMGRRFIIAVSEQFWC